MVDEKNQSDVEQNPYETPGIERLLYASVYVWPLEQDRRVSFMLDIDELQLKKGVESNSQFVSGYRWSSGFCLFTLSLFILFGSIASLDAYSIFIGLGTFAVLCFTFPRSFYRWHTRRLKSSFQWLWGPSRVEVSSEGLQWESHATTLLLRWDSFHTVRFSSNCIWFSTVHPFPLDLPIHRTWVDDSTWRELREVLSAHKGFFDIDNFWTYHRLKLVSFEGAGAPELLKMEQEGFPFRSRVDGQGYACESISSLFRYTSFLFTILPMMHFASAFFPQVSDWDDATIGFRKNGVLLYALFCLGFLQVVIPTVFRWFPAGIHWYQWTQLLLSSQTGYVSSDSICIASPAYQLTAKLGGLANVRLEKDYLVLELHKNVRHSLVIPRDQFTKADAKSVWAL